MGVTDPEVGIFFLIPGVHPPDRDLKLISSQKPSTPAVFSLWAGMGRLTWTERPDNFLRLVFQERLHSTQDS